MKKIVSLLFLIYSDGVFSKTIQQLSPVVSNGDIIKLFLSLLCVITLVLIFSYLFRKMNGLSFGGSGTLNIISSLSVGPKEKILLLDVAGENLLIGVSAGSISLLKSIEAINLKKELISKDLSFSDNLKKYLNKVK